MTQPIPQISEAELEILKLLWKKGPTTASHLRKISRERGKEWAATTILTLLRRLEEKGCVDVDRSSGTHIFSAAVDRDEVLKSRLTDLADKFCDGVKGPLVQALVQGRALKRSEIDELRSALDDLDRKRRRKK